MKRIAFIIIGTNQNPWRRIYLRGQLPTWISQLNEKETHLVVYTDSSMGFSYPNKKNGLKIDFSNKENRKIKISPAVFHSKHEAYFRGSSGFGAILNSTLSGFEYILDSFNPEYIVRTNISSYWNLPQLRNLLENAPSSNYFAGVTGRVKRGNFISGAGMIMSEDVARLFINSASKFDTSYIDDMSFGLVAQKLEIEMTNLPRIDLANKKDVKLLSTNILSSAFHFRCKSQIDIGIRTIRQDASIMKSLHARLIQHRK